MNKTALAITGKVLKIIGYMLASAVLVVIITLCIVAVAMAIYSMQFAESSFDMDISSDNAVNLTSFVYCNDSTGKPQLLKQLSTDEHRVEVKDWTIIPKHTYEAIVATEDKRYWQHKGVDWSRTVMVTLRMIVNKGGEGGSTITQQLVRAVTKDNAESIGRKLREIFRALSLERANSKDEILRAYLNQIPWGSTTYGIASAAQYYYGKDINSDDPAQQLTIAESCLLAGIIRSPTNMSPYNNLGRARERELYALKSMYDQGYITRAQYNEAKDEPIHFRRPVLGAMSEFGYDQDAEYNTLYGLSGGTEEQEAETPPPPKQPYKWNGDYEPQSWYVDAALMQAAADLAAQKGVSREEGFTLLRKGGYSVYLNMNMDVQNALEEKFRDPLTVLRGNYPADTPDKDLLQASFVIMDYRGNVVALAGGLGDKPGDYVFNRATQAKQPVASTIKPISVYGPAVDLNKITYSTMLRDIPGIIDSGVNKHKKWPVNYEGEGGAGDFYPAYYAVMKSRNTIAIRTLSLVGLRNSMSYLQDRLGISTVTEDASWSSIGLGAVSMKLYELAAAYQIFGSGGLYYKPALYSRVTDSTGRDVLKQDVTGTQALARDSAYVVNRMMLQVILDPAGTGQHAKIPGIEVVGKTGTENDNKNLLFAGLTPQYVGVFRLGYDDGHTIPPYNTGNWQTLARVWNNVMMSTVYKNGTADSVKTFAVDPDVEVRNYCNISGLLAGPGCWSTGVGYYRKSNLPALCDATNHNYKTYWSTHGDWHIPYYHANGTVTEETGYPAE